MKRKINTLILLGFMSSCIAWMNCGDEDNPLAPSELAGTWKLVTFTDKTDNITANAGEPTDVGNGVTLTITATLVLTETRFTFTMTMITSIPGLPDQTETQTVSGTYSISGSTLTTVDDGTGETDTATISLSGNRMTLDDDEVILVFEKQ